MASNGSVVLPKGGEEYYGLDRDATETARLNVQHYAITKSIGFLIYPSIPTTNLNLCIADFGCGTGIWLTELSKIVPASTKLLGFDISSAQFPPVSRLPENVSFHKHNILKPLPESYHGTFDIIAVRGLITVLAGGEWDKAVSNLVPLLKHGGWLQWIDPAMTPNSFKAVQSQAMAPRNSLAKGIIIVNQWANMLGRNWDECQRLPDIFRSSGLESIEHDLISTDNDASTRRDFSVEIVIASKAVLRRFANMEGSGMTMEEAVALGHGMMNEVEMGKAYLRMDLHIVVGRKPDEPKSGMALN